MTKTYVFVNVATGTFWLIRSNVDSKRVLTSGGRLGTKGTTRRLVFDGQSREDIRAYVDGRIDTKTAKGYVEVL